MYIIDTALRKLEAENKPIRIGLIGAGFAARAFAIQVMTAIPGMRISAVCNRTHSYAEQLFQEALGSEANPIFADNQNALNEAIDSNKHVYTDNPNLLTDSDRIDVIMEITGTVEYAAQIVMHAIDNGKHVVHLNNELDGTIGPIIKKYADQKGVIFTQADGDQPGKIMNIVREVEMLGFKPVLAGNIKSLIDFYRTPETQKNWSAENFQRPIMPTSFADGTKIAYEMSTVANATGFKVGKRNMYAPKATHVDEAPGLFPMDQMMNGGLVDYLLGAQPSFGVFVLGYGEHEVRNRIMRIYKMGNGPLYTFYIASHLGPLEAPFSIPRALLFNDMTIVPKAGPVAGILTVAKKDIKKGEPLDGIGGFTCYGMLDNMETLYAENLLPMGASEGCVATQDIAKDTPITYNMVTVPKGRLVDKLLAEQRAFVW